MEIVPKRWSDKRKKGGAALGPLSAPPMPRGDFLACAGEVVGQFGPQFGSSMRGDVFYTEGKFFI